MNLEVSSALKQLLNIALPVNNANDAKRFRNLVNDQMRVNRPEHNISIREIRALVTHARHLRQLTELPIV